jgi:hypothetical protein
MSSKPAQVRQSGRRRTASEECNGSHDAHRDDNGEPLMRTSRNAPPREPEKPAKQRLLSQLLKVLRSKRRKAKAQWMDKRAVAKIDNRIKHVEKMLNDLEKRRESR